MSEIKKFCFLDKNRPCDLTCKAAFEVDDPEDPVDCHFIWLAYHFGESMFSLKRTLEGVKAPSAKPGPASASPGPFPSHEN